MSKEEKAMEIAKMVHKQTERYGFPTKPKKKGIKTTKKDR